MRIAVIADVFPPLRSSGAVQLRDLARELVRQGHRPTVMVPAYDGAQPWLIETMNDMEVIRLKAPRTKDVSYVRRTVAEFLMPFAMLKSLRKSPLSDVRWDGVIWYSPTIFLGPIANALKKSGRCKSYLIVRDIFPEWAVDMGLLSRGLPYQFFNSIANYQYSVADVIGVQTPGNLPYFEEWSLSPGRRVEVLHNWLANAPLSDCTISIADGPLAGRIIFVYAGNMGVAQGMDILIDLAERLLARTDIGFLFVGRGSDAQRLREVAKTRDLVNVVFHDEIEPAEISGLYAQCHAGIVALDPRHKTHNIPGKFLSYMQSGLPVLANINRGNDLAEMIERENVGRVCVENSVGMLHSLALDMVDKIVRDPTAAARCKKISAQLFSPTVAAKQILAALEK